MYPKTAQALAAAERMGALPTNDPLAGGNWALGAIGAYDAWDVATGKGITVAVLDTGIDVDHVDLDANVWRNRREVAGDGIDNDRNGFVDDVHGWNFTASGKARNVNDAHGHGTHVAGLIAAEAGNREGVAGIAPDAEIMAVKVLDDRGTGSTGTISQGIDYAIEMGADIVNLSLGGDRGTFWYESAIQRAQEAGVIVVAAAGNGGDGEGHWPAAYTAKYDNVVSVAASTKKGVLTNFTNWSDSRTTVDLAAPGERLKSTLPDDEYGYKSGTSMATPIVAGAAAAIWSARPDWTYRKVIDAIETSVDPMSSKSKKTATNGIVDLDEAMGLTGAARVSKKEAPKKAAPKNEAPELKVKTLVTALEEESDLPANGVRLADLKVADDGVGKTVLDLKGPDATDFLLRGETLWLRGGVDLDHEDRSELSVTITLDDPGLGRGPEASVDYVLRVLDAEEPAPKRPAPAPEPGEGRAPDAFGKLAFWLDASAETGDGRTLTDLSGRGNDAWARWHARAEVEDGGLAFEKGDLYQIDDTSDLNTASKTNALTLSFAIETGADVESRQFLYEQGGTTRGLSVTLEGGEIHMTGWNLAEASWGVETVSAAVEANEQIAVSLVLDARAGTLAGYVDGALVGTQKGAGTLYKHSDDIALGGVLGAARDADGDVAWERQGRFEGVLYEAAAHGAALKGSQVAALHAGLAARASEAPAGTGPAQDAFVFTAEEGGTDPAALAHGPLGGSDGAGPAGFAPRFDAGDPALSDLLALAGEAYSDLPLG